MQAIYLITASIGPKYLWSYYERLNYIYIMPFWYKMPLILLYESYDYDLYCSFSLVYYSCVFGPDWNYGWKTRRRRCNSFFWKVGICLRLYIHECIYCKFTVSRGVFYVFLIFKIYIRKRRKKRLKNALTFPTTLLSDNSNLRPIFKFLAWVWVRKLLKYFFYNVSFAFFSPFDIFF